MRHLKWSPWALGTSDGHFLRFYRSNDWSVNRENNLVATLFQTILERIWVLRTTVEPWDHRNAYKDELKTPGITCHCIKQLFITPTSTFSAALDTQMHQSLFTPSYCKHFPLSPPRGDFNLILHFSSLTPEQSLPLDPRPFPKDSSVSQAAVLIGLEGHL